MKLWGQQELGHGAQVKDDQLVETLTNPVNSTWNHTHVVWKMISHWMFFLGSRMVQVEFMRCNVGAMYVEV